MKQLAASLRRQVHTLAALYHWSEAELLGLGYRRRRAYLALIEADADAELLAQLRT